MSLTQAQERQVLAYIPTQPNRNPLYSVDYHESKINHAMAFNPNFSRAEAWALSMYLGPQYYCKGINRTLLNMPLKEAEKFHLIAEAAKSALERIPGITPEALRALPQPDKALPPAEFLKRFVLYREETLALYHVGEIRKEPAFFSTTYWQAPVGQLKQYAENANTVFHIHVLAQNSWGKYINSLKRRTREGEVLFQPGTSFEVTGKELQSYPLDILEAQRKQMHVITLQEVKAKKNANRIEI